MRREFRYGRKIRQLREDQSWTQEHLAEAAGIEVRTVQRVEKDATCSPETIQAIAAAFNVSPDSLRTTRLTPESKLLRTLLVSTYEEFVTAEEAHRHQAFTRAIVAPLAGDERNDVRELFDQVFADRECIQPDDADLWRSYISWIQEPLDVLFGRGLVFFILDESRDLLLPSIGDIKPLADHIDDWRVRHFMLVPKYGCFHATPDGPLHRFDRDCEAGNNLWFRTTRETIGVHVYSDALWTTGESGRGSAVRWCDRCFPPLPGGDRITVEYAAEVTGLSRVQLLAAWSALAGDGFLEGLA